MRASVAHTSAGLARWKRKRKTRKQIHVRTTKSQYDNFKEKDSTMTNQRRDDCRTDKLVTMRISQQTTKTSEAQVEIVERTN